MSSLKLLRYLSILILGVFLSQCPVRAQEHDHRFYSPQCCSGKDCKPIDSCFDLNENADGSYDYGHFHFRKDQVHPSEDNKCHVCIHPDYGFSGQGEPHETPMCVYVQHGV